MWSTRPRQRQRRVRARARAPRACTTATACAALGITLEALPAHVGAAQAAALGIRLGTSGPLPYAHPGWLACFCPTCGLLLGRVVSASRKTWSLRLVSLLFRGTRVPCAACSTRPLDTVWAPPDAAAGRCCVSCGGRGFTMHCGLKPSGRGGGPRPPPPPPPPPATVVPAPDCTLGTLPPNGSLYDASGSRACGARLVFIHMRGTLLRLRDAAGGAPLALCTRSGCGALCEVTADTARAGRALLCAGCAADAATLTASLGEYPARRCAVCARASPGSIGLPVRRPGVLPSHMGELVQIAFMCPSHYAPSMSAPAARLPSLEELVAAAPWGGRGGSRLVCTDGGTTCVRLRAGRPRVPLPLSGLISGDGGALPPLVVALRKRNAFPSIAANDAKRPRLRAASAKRPLPWATLDIDVPVPESPVLLTSRPGRARARVAWA